MSTPTLKAIKIDDVQDLRSAVIEAHKKLQKIRAVSDETFLHCENEHYESEGALNEELHKFFSALSEIEFWTWEIIRELEAAA